MDLSRHEIMELIDIVERLSVMKESLHPALQSGFDEAINGLDIYLPQCDPNER